jgi:murein L,D-transpeptidase YcbB/YkuD
MFFGNMGKKLQGGFSPQTEGGSCWPVLAQENEMASADEGNALFTAVAAVASQMELEFAALLAVVEVESGGQTHAMINGREEPLIRFEGHYFHRLLPAAKRHKAITQGLAHPVAGKVRNPVRQAARWAKLRQAEEIDRDAALSSVSWGVGQVMGAHWRWLGYPSAVALAAEARSGLEGQVRLFAKFIDKAGLAAALQAHDWAGFARAYNGPAYRDNRYDAKMAAAYERHAGMTPRPSRNAMALLRLGARGAAVEALQRDLRQLGYPLIADGDFGPATHKALASFQKSAGLKPDGVFGAAAQEAMMRRLPAARENRTGAISRLAALFTGNAVV